MYVCMYVYMYVCMCAWPCAKLAPKKIPLRETGAMQCFATHEAYEWPSQYNHININAHILYSYGRLAGKMTCHVEPIPKYHASVYRITKIGDRIRIRQNDLSRLTLSLSG